MRTEQPQTASTASTASDSLNSFLTNQSMTKNILEAQTTNSITNFPPLLSTTTMRPNSLQTASASTTQPPTASEAAEAGDANLNDFEETITTTSTMTTLSSTNTTIISSTNIFSANINETILITKGTIFIRLLD